MVGVSWTEYVEWHLKTGFAMWMYVSVKACWHGKIHSWINSMPEAVEVY